MSQATTTNRQRTGPGGQTALHTPSKRKGNSRPTRSRARTTLLTQSAINAPRGLGEELGQRAVVRRRRDAELCTRGSNREQSMTGNTSK